jgi:hypothetical protein
MTITPIAFVNGGNDIASDDDLKARYPLMGQDLWNGQVSYRIQLQGAFNRSLREVTRNDTFKDAALISNSAANIAWFKQAVIEAALSGIFLAFMGEAGDRWHTLHSYHEKQYQMLISSPKLDYDTDEDGSVSEDEEATSGVTEFVR